MENEKTNLEINDAKETMLPLTEKTTSEVSVNENEIGKTVTDGSRCDNVQKIVEEQLLPEEIVEPEGKELSKYFSPKNSFKDAVKVFGQSEEELSKEFKTYKARKMFNKMDYLLTDTELTDDEFIKECETAGYFGFKSVTVLPTKVKIAKLALKGKQVSVRALISFPYGEDVFKVKLTAVKLAVQSGADGIAVTVSTGAVKNGNQITMGAEIKKIVKAARKKPVTVILDANKMSEREIEKCSLALIKCANVYSVMPSTLYDKEKPSVSVLKDVIKVVSGKCFVDGGGELSTVEETVGILSLGANGITSVNCPLIAKDTLKKLNA